MSAGAVAGVAIVLVALVAVVAGARALGRRTTFVVADYQLNGRIVVRCRDGHLFTTIWVPGVSLKAVRLGTVRFQRCPVGNHVTFVAPVRVSNLTGSERRFASLHDDGTVV